MTSVKRFSSGVTDDTFLCFSGLFSQVGEEFQMSERRSIICNIIRIIDLISDEEMCPIPVFGEYGDVTLKRRLQLQFIFPILFSVSPGPVSFPSSSRILVV